jgi:hypothetical protein
VGPRAGLVFLKFRKSKRSEFIFVQILKHGVEIHQKQKNGCSINISLSGFMFIAPTPIRTINIISDMMAPRRGMSHRPEVTDLN